MSSLFLLIAALTPESNQPATCVKSPYGVGKGQLKPFVCSRAFKPSTAADATSVQKAGGPSLNWPSRKATFKINQSGTQDIAGTQELAMIRTGFKSWQIVDGTDFTFTDGGLTTSDRIGFDFLHLDDNENVVLFQGDWSHDVTIIGLTTATFNAQTGEIFDADIELNDEYYDFTVGDESVETDLLNTVTHEIGHFIGFDHTDEPGSTIDVDCATTAAMSKSSSIGEVSKRILAPSDELGMTFVYGRGKPIGFCNAPAEASGPAPRIEQVGSQLQAGCSQTSGTEASWLLLTMLLVWKSRRRC